MRRACWQMSLGLLLLAGRCGELDAFEALSGCFVADAVCPATTSIRQQGDPGELTTEPGRSYPLLGSNRKDRATHFQIRVPGAEPGDRWVPVGCGHRVEACEGGAGPPVADFVLRAGAPRVAEARHLRRRHARDLFHGRAGAPGRAQCQPGS
jgi:hypothetical protein